MHRPHIYPQLQYLFYSLELKASWSPGPGARPPGRPRALAPTTRRYVRRRTRGRSATSSTSSSSSPSPATSTPVCAARLCAPAALVGDGFDTVTTTHFEAPRLLTVRGAEPAWQFCHVDDLGSAVAVVVARGVEGAVSVGARAPDPVRPRATHRDARGRAQPERCHGNCRPPPPRWGVAGTCQRPGVRGFPVGGVLPHPAGSRLGAGP